MNEDELRGALLDALGEIAPEIDPAGVDPDAGLADQLEIDSIDLLNLVVSVHERTGIEIPERDYGRLRTLNSAVAYLLEVQARPGPPA